MHFKAIVLSKFADQACRLTFKWKQSDLILPKANYPAVSGTCQCGQENVLLKGHQFQKNQHTNINGQNAFEHAGGATELQCKSPPVDDELRLSFLLDFLHPLHCFHCRGKLPVESAERLK